MKELYRQRGENGEAGPWYAQWWCPHHRQREQFSTGQTDRDAARAVRKAEVKARAESHAQGQTALAFALPSTIGAAIQRVIDRPPPGRRGRVPGPETLSMRVEHKRRICGFYGEARPLADFEDAQGGAELVAAFVDHERGRGVHDRTISKRLGTLYVALDEAARKKELRRVPPRQKIDTAQRPYEGSIAWSRAEFEALYLAASERRRRHLLCGVMTGMRQRGIETWSWSDVNLADATWMRSSTKNHAKRRKLRLPVRLLLALREWHAADRPKPETPIVGRWTNIRHQLPALCSRAGVTVGTGWNAFRHTCAKWIYEAGVRLEDARLWFGHKSTRMLESVYFHSEDQASVKIAAALDGDRALTFGERVRRLVGEARAEGVTGAALAAALDDALAEHAERGQGAQVIRFPQKAVAGVSAGAAAADERGNTSPEGNHPAPRRVIGQPRGISKPPAARNSPLRANTDFQSVALPIELPGLGAGSDLDPAFSGQKGNTSPGKPDRGAS